jgi:YcaO-like protein with predicted kinase domain
VTVEKRFRHGTHRHVAPDATWKRVWPLAGAMGITRVAGVTGLDCLGVPVAIAVRPLSRSVAVSAGKGADPLAAKVSALMEAVESFHAERVERPRPVAAYDEIRRTCEVVDVDALPRLATSTFAPGRPIPWVEGHDIVGDEPVWLPYESVHTDFRVPAPAGSGCFHATSNGLAAGNHLVEAITHGLCELIERDASALWRVRSSVEHRRRRVDESTVDDPCCREVLDRYRDAGLRVAIWETTTDLEAPAFLCMVAEADPDPMRPLPASGGAGCHPARAIALLRALTEAAQTRLTLIAGTRDDVTRAQYREARSPERARRDRIALELGAPGRAFGGCGGAAGGETLTDDLAGLLGRLRGAGLDRVVVVDLTREDLGIPVVRVVVPGLEGLAHVPGYVPGARMAAVLHATRLAA